MSELQDAIKAARIFAESIRVAGTFYGMNAENESRKMRGESLAYVADDYDRLALHLTNAEIEILRGIK